MERRTYLLEVQLRKSVFKELDSHTFANVQQEFFSIFSERVMRKTAACDVVSG